MIKKILMWSIYAGLVGLLIFGAVVRTKAKVGDTTRADESLEKISYQSISQETSVIRQYGKGSGGNEEYSESREELHVAQEEKHETIRLTGVVTGRDAGALWIETDEGENLEFARRVWRFIQESSLEISIGDLIVLEGFFESGEFEISYLENLTTGASLQIREDSGRPLWGGGNGGK